MIDEVCCFALAVFAGTGAFVFTVWFTDRLLTHPGRDRPRVCRSLRVRRPARQWEPPTAQRSVTVYPDGREVKESEA